MKLCKLTNRLLAVAALLFFAFTAAEAKENQKAKIVCGPYIQCVTETGFTVTWVTDIDAICWVETAPDDGTHFYNCERTKHYDMRGYGMQPIGKIHKVRVEGLEAGSTCRYRLMAKGVISFEGSGDVRYTRASGSDVYKKEPYKINLFKSSYDTLRFDIYNDIHGRDEVLGTLMDAARPDLDFVCFNGDMTSNIETHEMIQSMYLGTASKKLGGATPLIVSRGNHELRGKEAIKWFDYFATPTGQTYYAVRIGDFFFIMLDACEDKPDSDIEYGGTIISEPYLLAQEAWLKNVIQTEECKSAKVKIAFCHIPPDVKGWRGNVNVCRYFIPHLNKAGLDMMFCAHIHKWRQDMPGDGRSDAAFPVVCLPNAQRSEVTATTGNLIINTFDSTNMKTQSLELPLGK